jgi:hypothetical protein
VYRNLEGENIYIHVPKRLATHVSGYGIAGVIVPFAEIKLTGFKIKRRMHFRRVDKRHINWLIEQDKRKYRLYKSLPQGLSAKQISDIVIDDIMKNL